MGTKWATEKRSAVLEVPSVIIPSELNFLLNPEHPDFSKIEIGNPKPVGWDQRLLALLNKNPKGLEDMPPFLTAGVRLTRPWHLPLAALPTIPVIDPTNPRARNMLAMSSRYGSTQLPGDYVAIAYGTDPASAYKSAIAQRNQKMRHPVPAIDIASVKEIPSSISGAREYILQGDFDARDGQGSKAMTVQLVMSQPFGPTGGWQMIVYQAVIPVNLVAEESATAAAIMRSYNINSQIIRGESRAQIGAIQNLAAIVQERSRRSEADTEAIIAQGERRWDEQDRQSKAFQNYMLDQSVIRDKELNAHGTVDNDYSDTLIKSRPDRFELVAPSDSDFSH